MSTKRFYVDTSIWLNLFKKEGDPTKGVPFWKIAEDFIQGVLKSEDEVIYYSPIILRELEIKFGSDYYKCKEFFEKEQKFIKILLIDEDSILARKLESKYDFEISFYDLLHLLISKRLGATLVTRDKFLIQIARENGVRASKPEYL